MAHPKLTVSELVACGIGRARDFNMASGLPDAIEFLEEAAKRLREAKERQQTKDAISQLSRLSEYLTAGDLKQASDRGPNAPPTASELAADT